MAYERLHWVESETPLSADNFNNIEDGIEELQAQKVDKVSGKALSDNNYTSEEKTKLAGIEAGAEVNVQPDWDQSDSTADDYIKNKPGNATTSTAGLMSATDKSKLDGVQAGAQVNPGVATTSANGLMSAADKTKLNGIAAGAEVNQNAFSNVKVGSTTVAADGKTDTLELVAGSNVTLTPDATNDKVTIAATDTKYNAATTSAAGLMSAADKSKLNGIASGAQVNPGNATTSAAGLMSSTDKTFLSAFYNNFSISSHYATFTITSPLYKEGTITLSKTGYYPIAITGFTIYCANERVWLSQVSFYSRTSGGCNVDYTAEALDSCQNVRVTIDVLWIKIN